jgi:hypothetical protein
MEDGDNNFYCDIPTKPTVWRLHSGTCGTLAVGIQVTLFAGFCTDYSDLLVYAILGSASTKVVAVQDQ